MQLRESFAVATFLFLTATSFSGVRTLAQSGATTLSASDSGPQDNAAPGPGVRSAESCSLCHAESEFATAMRDHAGRSVAPFDLWRSTMMANAARDPFWRAVMSAEMAAAPAAKELIAQECMKCHAPLAAQVGFADHGTGDPLHALACEGDLGELARDGVSCTICHGMAPDGLGSPISFTAGFTLDRHRRLFGPHRDPVPGPMRVHSGFTPEYGEHVIQSKLCGSCHTLITHALDDAGQPSGAPFHEQTPYLEWRNSAFSNEGPDGQPLAEAPAFSRTCQDCHLPRQDVDGEEIVTRLAHNPPGRDFPFIEPRRPFGRHLLVGGNTLMLAILRDNAEALGVTAPRAAFDATIEATRQQLQERAAGLAIRRADADAGRVAFDVTITNRTGHKLPTGHPSRRMWLEVVVRDATGAIAFASGRSGADGRILDADGEVVASEFAGGPIEPHRDLVEEGDQIASYRGVIADQAGNPTHTLLQGTTWYIDNRILPNGWNPAHPDAEATRPAGIAGDENFLPGQDRVRYCFSAPSSEGLTVEARLLYQSVSPRWVAELARFETPEIAAFLEYYEAAERAPEVLARAVLR